jgi:hypothetical protein
MYKKIITSIVAIAIMTMALTVSVGAIQFSDSNRDIEIISGTYTGYRFFGPESPHSPIDTSNIAYVKFYIKFEDLQHHEPANVLLAYNSGTTGWVSRTHDLNDGLIVQIELTAGGVAQDDFFEVALTTDNSAIHGTYSVEVRDWSGKVLGEGVYESNIPESNEVVYGTETNEPDDDDYGSDYVPDEGEDGYDEYYGNETEGDATEEKPDYEGETVGTDDNPQTDGANILTATGMTIVSALAILSMTKKSKRERGE